MFLKSLIPKSYDCVIIVQTGTYNYSNWQIYDRIQHDYFGNSFRDWLNQMSSRLGLVQTLHQVTYSFKFKFYYDHEYWTWLHLISIWTTPSFAIKHAVGLNNSMILSKLEGLVKEYCITNKNLMVITRRRASCQVTSK